MLLSFAAASAIANETVLRVGVQRFPPDYGNPYPPIAQPAVLALQAIYDPLTRIGADGEILPGLAVAWSQETPTTWIFKLRERVSFSNGEPFNAAAIVEAFTYLQTEPGRRDSIAILDFKTAFASFQARDDHTLEIVTVAPDPVLPLHLTSLRIPAPRRWAELGREKFQKAPVGTGPFQAESWENARLELTAFKGAWRAPKVDRIRMALVGDPIVRLQAFSSHAVDVAMALGPQDRADVEASGGRLLSRPAPTVNYILFVSAKDGPLKDTRVRQALNYAANKERIIEAFLGNAVKPVGQFSHPMAYGYDPALPAYPYDPERARRLLAEAGYAKGFSFVMLVEPTAGGNAVDWYQLLAQDFEAVGARMSIRGSTTSRLTEHILTGNWPADASAFAFAFAGFDTIRGYRFRSCATANPYHCDPEMTPLITAAQTAVTPEARLTATRAALVRERENPPGILLWQGVGFDAVAAHVKDFIVEQDNVRWDLVHVTTPQP